MLGYSQSGNDEICGPVWLILYVNAAETRFIGQDLSFEFLKISSNLSRETEAKERWWRGNRRRWRHFFSNLANFRSTAIEINLRSGSLHSCDTEANKCSETVITAVRVRITVPWKRVMNVMWRPPTLRINKITPSAEKIKEKKFLRITFEFPTAYTYEYRNYNKTDSSKTHNYLRSFGRWDHGSESHSRHGCLCMLLFCVCLFLCGG
jgi:hypothetical protein